MVEELTNVTTPFSRVFLICNLVLVLVLVRFAVLRYGVGDSPPGLADQEAGTKNWLFRGSK
jgi:hypothetical protein